MVHKSHPGASIHPDLSQLAVSRCTCAPGEALADLDELGGAAGLARSEAAAAVCVWLGASVLRTRHVAEVRRCADMTESILGRRPPAWAVRGLA